MPRPRWLHLELLPQLRHIQPQVMRVLDRIGPPNLTQQLAMRHDPVGILHKDHQQLALARRQVNHRNSAADLAFDRVSPHVAKRASRLGIGRARRVPQSHAHPRQPPQGSTIAGDPTNANQAQGLNPRAMFAPSTFVDERARDTREGGRRNHGPPVQWLCAIQYSGNARDSR
jgi:hypothetical protein